MFYLTPLIWLVPKRAKYVNIGVDISTEEDCKMTWNLMLCKNNGKYILKDKCLNENVKSKSITERELDNRSNIKIKWTCDNASIIQSKQKISFYSFCLRNRSVLGREHFGLTLLSLDDSVNRINLRTFDCKVSFLKIG